MRPDAYIRILGHRRYKRFESASTNHSPLLFVDAARGVDLAVEVPKLPLGLLQGATAVVFRCEPDQAFALLEIRSFLASPGDWWILHHPVGSPPILSSPSTAQATASGQQELNLLPHPTPSHGLELARRSCDLECRALLAWGEAISAPKNFHYLLPSGRHAESFVRGASMIQTDRDADVLAMWLREHCAPKTGIILDTPGLLPVALALRSQLASHSCELVRCSVLDGYPHTALAIAEALAGFSENHPDSVIACVSVSSSSHLVGSIRQEFQFLEVPTRAVISIVRLGAGGSDAIPGDVSLGEMCTVQPEKSRPYTTHRVSCPACAIPAKATLVPVDGRLLDVVFPSLVSPVMPVAPTSNPGRLRGLWEAADSQAAISFYALADANAEPWRAPAERLGIKVDLARLIQSPPFREELAERLAEEARPNHPYDLLLVSDADAGRPNWSDVEGAIVPRLGGPRVEIYPVQGVWPQPVENAVRNARNILVFTLGGVTGGTVMVGLSGVQSLRSGPGYAVAGVVAHSRPSSGVAWKGIENAFHPLKSLWHTPLPDRSPFEDEYDLLTNTTVESAQAEELLNERFRFVQGQVPSGALELGGVLLGSRPSDQITPNSLFGQGLSGSAIVAAAGSAIHARRLQFEGEVRACKFDIAKMSRSYYDPMIFCSMLRWIQPHEVWWGRDDDEALQVIMETYNRAQHFHDGHGSSIVICELLLAFALGKVSPALRDNLTSLADDQVARTPALRPHIEIAMALLDHVDEGLTGAEEPRSQPIRQKPACPPSNDEGDGDGRLDRVVRRAKDLVRWGSQLLRRSR